MACGDGGNTIRGTAVSEEEGCTMPSLSPFASRLRLVGALCASGALALGSLPAWAAEPADAPADALADPGPCVKLELDNPHPGDTLSVGKYTISGRAFD